MKTLTKLCAVTVALLVGAALTSCGKSPTAPQSITIINTQTQTTSGGGSGGTAPGQGGSGVIGSVKVVQFGEHCPSGIAESGADRSVRIGCTKFLTCTPFLTDGQKALPQDHGPAPDYFGPVSSSTATVVDVGHPSEPFNLDVTGRAEGTASFRCVAKGVQSEQFDLQVVR